MVCAGKCNSLPSLPTNISSSDQSQSASYSCGARLVLTSPHQPARRNIKTGVIYALKAEFASIPPLTWWCLLFCLPWKNTQTSSNVSTSTFSRELSALSDLILQKRTGPDTSSPSFFLLSPQFSVLAFKSNLSPPATKYYKLGNRGSATSAQRASLQISSPPTSINLHEFLVGEKICKTGLEDSIQPLINSNNKSLFSQLSGDMDLV